MNETKISYKFGKDLRLLTASHYKSIFDDASYKASHKHFLILARNNAADKARLGVIVAKKNCKLAVNRNRFKRLTRESFRTKQHKLPHIDAIVLARRGTETLANKELLAILDNLWARIASKANPSRK